MPVLGTTFPNLVDLAKKTDPDGSIAHVVERLTQTNPILSDMTWREGNLPTGHRMTSRTALPSVAWRRFNEGITAGKGATEQVDETCGSLEGLSKVDAGLAELSANAAAFRADEDQAFLQSLNNEVSRALFYESSKTGPERIHGLSARLDSTTNNPAAAQIVKADASASGTDQASIWLIGWSPDTIFGIYPKGSRAGLSSEDLGKQLVQDGTGKEFTAWVTHWRWRLGLAVRDSRYLVRVANVDMGRMAADITTAAQLPDVLQDAIAAVYELESVAPVFYMNRTVFSAFNKQLMKKSANFLEYVERGGRRVPHFLGIPIRVVDALVSTESVVT
jgi:major capsid protein gp7